MNILPLVITVLMILGIAASTLFRGRMATIIEKKSIEGYLNAQRKIWNKHERALYTDAEKAPEVAKAAPVAPTAVNPELGPGEKKEESAKEEDEDEEEVIKKKYFRDRKCTRESGKFNLYLLLHDHDSAQINHLYHPAARLIRKLYQNAPFWKEGEKLEYQILDALMKIGNHSFFDAIPENSELAPIFYKMLKGSNTYVVGTSEGIPPFLDFFKDDRPKDKNKIDFRYAPKPVLQALLEDELFMKVEALERKENTPLPKEKFDPLLETFPQKKSELQQLDLFMYSSKDNVNPDIASDGNTGITVRR